MLSVRFISAWAAISLPLIVFAQKKPLDHSVYDGWKSIRSTSISRDGAWVLYVVAPQEGDAVATIRNVKDGHTLTVPRPSTIQFTKDSKYVVAMSIPPFADSRKARRDKVKPDDMPKSNLVIVDLAAGTQKVVEKVQSYSLASEDQGFLLYKPEPPKEAPAAPATPATEKKGDEEDQRPRPGGGAAAPGAGGAAAAKKDGDPYVVLNLRSGPTPVSGRNGLQAGTSKTFEKVTSAVWTKDGNLLALSTGTKDGKGDGITLYSPQLDRAYQVIQATGKYPRIALNQDGSLLAFTTDKDDQKAKKPTLSLYFCDVTKFLENKEKNGPRLVGADSMPKDWTINEGGAISFSESGKRLLYRTSPKPLPDPEPVPDDEKVSVDVWNWQDPDLQPAQLLQAAQERARGYQAVYEVATGKSVQLADRDLQNVAIGNKGDGAYAVGSSDLAYSREGSWDPGYSDVYVVDVKTGKRTKVAKHVKGGGSLSPTGRYLTSFNYDTHSWDTTDLNSSEKVVLSKGIPFPLVDELDDHPDVAGPYGIVGWTKDDARALVADRYDIWECDPTGKTAPVVLTHGRVTQTVCRFVDLDPEEVPVNVDNVLLDMFNEDNKEDGLGRLQNGHIDVFFRDKKFFTGYQKAKNADTMVYTRQDFNEYPDIWLTNTNFVSPTKISDANPQQKDYLWGTAELVHWTSLDGIPLSGILIKPGGFEYGKKYPMITYFYERMSDDLYKYKAPSPSASTINWPLFASNGYCIFIPDIPYKVGYPGESAINAIMPGVQSIVDRGYVDPKKLAIQGQSWGGYQVAYMVTRTNMFACAEAGAPVSDMFSAYGGIRYGSGVVREMQYEHGQSRIGGTPWDSTLKYVENSPVFWADKVETPLMIMSNDKDGAVPHTQGIELFTALRRLDKPCWMVVYNEEDHNLVERKNRKDLSIRLSQFFDHYLKGAPMPVWMSKGIPAVDKGRTMGTELEKN